jgi:hypothetical protein
MGVNLNEYLTKMERVGLTSIAFKDGNTLTVASRKFPKNATTWVSGFYVIFDGQAIAALPQSRLGAHKDSECHLVDLKKSAQAIEYFVLRLKDYIGELDDVVAFRLDKADGARKVIEDAFASLSTKKVNL